MSKSKTFIHTVFFTVAILLSSLSFAADKTAGAAITGDMRDLKVVSCKDIMRDTGEYRAIALGVLHGYFLGKKGTTRYDHTKLSDASDKFTEYCLDNPNTKAIKAMATLLKK